MKLALALLWTLPLVGCAWLGPEEEDPPEQPLAVVPVDEPFDPSRVVDDTGGGELADSAADTAQHPEKEEEIATEAEAEVRENVDEQAVEAIDAGAVEDDEAKASVATNPPPEETGSGEKWTWTALDIVMELVIVLVLALAIATPLWLLMRIGR